MAIIIPTVIAFILLTLTQTVFIRISREEEFKIDADVIFLRIILYPDRKKNEKRSKKQKKSVPGKEKLLLITSLIERCDIRINSLSLKTEKFNRASAVLYGATSAFLSSILAFISLRARSFSFDSAKYLNICENQTKSIQFDATLELTFLEAVILLLRLKFKERRYS